ncbi:MAG: hypothetical protein QM638_19140 [Nocardioides sp.]|uniref:hypothetical protein n=1 Tax=Nocardioides sp. TaxID=35761 RepID=UPI0039E62D92
MARLRHPAVVTLFLAPALGEWLSGASPPLNMVWPPAFVLVVSLYGCGVLLCREIAWRAGLGLRGLCLLGAAYAVVEEALVDRFWFDVRLAGDGGIGHYSEVWHTSVLLAVNLTVFHIVVSVVSTIVLTELMFPGFRDRPWLEGRAWGIVAGSFVLLPSIAYGHYSLDYLPQRVVAALLVVALALVAIRLHGHPSLWASAAVPGPARRGVAAVSFLAAAANLLLMGLSDTGTPWPIAVVAVLAPVLLAHLLLRRRVSGPVFGRDGFRVVAGVLGFYCLFAFGVGLAGRFDLCLGAVAVGVLLWRIRRRQREWACPRVVLDG